MSHNPGSHHLMDQLSIGNVVKVALYLYRSHLKLYLKLALFAHLWLMVPIYGWAKFYATSGLISRLAFSELSGQPESLKAAKSYINQRMWNFLFTNILILITLYVGMSIASFLFGIIGASLSFVMTVYFQFPPIPIAQIRDRGNLPFANLQYKIIAFPTALATYLSPLWVYSRLFITDLPLSIENKVSSFKTIIKRSWELTNGFRKANILIIIIAFLITIPILPIVMFVWLICLRLLVFIINYNFLRYLAVNQSELFASFSTILSSLVTAIIIMPFWQAIKAVVYYEIRCRREGEGLDFEVTRE